MKPKEFIPQSKPRNFVAKNQKTAGAGAHKDKKRAEKQGDVKHKAKQFDESVEEGWKEKLAAAGLAATIGLGAAGGANARVLPGADPSINRLTGEPVATQQIKPSDAKKDAGQQKIGFSTEYLKKVVDGKHPRPMISVDDAKQELERRSQDVAEEAPPTAKGERMVKHIKKGYAKDGKLTDKERGIAYATAWKAHNKNEG